jgi:hypothetical protein
MTSRALERWVWPRSIWKVAWHGSRALLLLFFAAATALVVANTLPYYTFADDIPFFLEKAAVYPSVLWRAAFYVHVTGGVICLLAALPQFSKTILHRAPRLHRVLGWTYVLSVLVLTAPAGLYLAIFAKGGMAGRFGFIVLGAALFYTTWRGLEHVRARDFRGHAAWMIRSYAMAASALTFRVFYLALYAAGVGSEYVIAIWLSFFVNLFAAELLIRRPRKGLSL